ncbi:hypothetical protein AQUCO_00700956v1 [Aquilegia coerulea]|uniref:Uncharacterized protein n=1 Tax=Aquilegia coerulea TaxID=218851 RepID=A0A2G5EMI9_AQUCA|nr:hypothetical protein AQUCO_00700956v1 [Aquilegia coerulea]
MCYCRTVCIYVAFGRDGNIKGKKSWIMFIIWLLISSVILFNFGSVYFNNAELIIAYMWNFIILIGTCL